MALLISINQLWSVLFERGTLLEIDCFNKKIWQKSKIETLLKVNGHNPDYGVE